MMLSLSAAVAAGCLAAPITAAPLATTAPPEPVTEYVNIIEGWVTPPDGTSTDMMFATLEANGYSTAGITMSHNLERCGNLDASGCAVFGVVPGEIELVMDVQYVGTQTGLYILAHEHRHVVADLRSADLAVDECNADRFAEAVVPGYAGHYTMCDTHGVPFEGADYHPPINFVAE